MTPLWDRMKHLRVKDHKELFRSLDDKDRIRIVRRRLNDFRDVEGSPLRRQTMRAELQNQFPFRHFHVNSQPGPAIPISEEEYMSRINCRGAKTDVKKTAGVIKTERRVPASVDERANLVQDPRSRLLFLVELELCSVGV